MAILRYFRGLYQSHYQEMLKAENEDLLIRKYYVAYKSAGSPEERKQVLSCLFASSGSVNTEEVKRKAGKSDNDVINGLLGIIAKKL